MQTLDVLNSSCMYLNTAILFEMSPLSHRLNLKNLASVYSGLASLLPPLSSSTYFRTLYSILGLQTFSYILRKMAGVVQQPLKETGENQDIAMRPVESPRLSEGHDPVLRFAKLTDRARTPERGSTLAAGFDLYSAYDYTIPARGKVLAKTDIQIAVPDGCYGRIAPRSGLAHKHFIDVGAGVIDQDYRGNVGVILFNFAEKEFEVKEGDRIAQLICERIFIPKLEKLAKLDDTVRGKDGFGSTGKN